MPMLLLFRLERTRKMRIRSSSKQSIQIEPTLRCGNAMCELLRWDTIRMLRISADAAVARQWSVTPDQRCRRCVIGGGHPSRHRDASSREARDRRRRQTLCCSLADALQCDPAMHSPTRRTPREVPPRIGSPRLAPPHRCFPAVHFPVDRRGAADSILCALRPPGQPFSSRRSPCHTRRGSFTPRGPQLQRTIAAAACPSPRPVPLLLVCSARFAETDDNSTAINDAAGISV